MPTLRSLGLSSYETYLNSDYWRLLKKRYIYTNNHAECHICRKKHSLLLHHVRYDMLMNEKIGVSLYIICFYCHENIHFVRFMRFEKKTELTTPALMRRMYFLQLIEVIKRRRALWIMYLLLKWITA